MNRRKFLGLLGAGGLAAGGTTAGFVAGVKKDGDAESRARELSDAAGPLGDTQGHGRIIWSARTDERALALTFDDGPFPEFTPRVLDTLDRYDIKATFNVMGFNGEKHQELLREEVRRGHEIGNHTWTHLDLAFQSPAETRRQLVQGKESIEQVAGVKTRIFRPPRGELTGVAARVAVQLGYDILLWSLAGDVPGFENPKEVIDHVARGLLPGTIVGFHDGIGRGTFSPKSQGAALLRERREAEVKALPDVIELALERGYRFLTVSELMALEPAEVRS